LDEAFDRLRRYARRLNLRLVDVARDIGGGGLDPAVVVAGGPARDRGRA
jgi:hypothetical protein